MKKAKTKTSKKLLRTKDNNDMWWGASLVGILYFALLLSTAPRTNVSYADSDELLTVAYNLGIGHPPGYPIYILLLSLFLKLPIGEIAFRGHVFSIICHSLTLSFVFAFLWKLIKYLQVKNKSLELVNKNVDRWIMASIGSMVLGANYIFWLYGEIAEKFSFSSLLISILLFWIMRIWENKKDKLTDWIVLGGLIGLMIGHHQSLILLAPMALILYSFKKTKEKSELDRKKTISALTGFVGMIIVTGFSLVILNSNTNANISWNFQNNMDGFLDHILRREFAPTNPVTGEIGSAYVNTKRFGSNIIGGLPIFLKYSAQYFGLINLIVLIIGVLFLIKEDRDLSYVLGFGLLASFLFSCYVTVGDFNMMPSIVRQYLLSYVMMAIFMAMGWYMLLLRLIKGLKVLTDKNTVKYFLVGGILIILGLRFWQIYPQANLSDYDFVSRFHKETLNRLPSDSILLCFTDMSCFALLYEQNVNKTREDVIILPAAYPLVKNKLESIDGLKGYDYEQRVFRIFDYITWNVGKRRIFTLDFDQQYYDILGLAYGFLYYIPDGYLAEITKKVPEEFNSPDYSFSQEIKDNPAPELDIMRKWINTMMPRIHFKNAAMYVKMGDRIETRNQLNMASDILHQIPEIDINQVEGQRKFIEDSQVIDIFLPGSTSFAVEDIWENVNRYYENEVYSQAYLGALGILSYDPINKDARTMIADIYEKQNNWQMALVEYKNLTKHYDDREFLDKINKLNDKIKYGI